MTRHVANVKINCPRCQREADCAHVASSDLPQLRFSTTVRCANCGLSEEMHGSELSVDARKAFCSAEGRWSGVVGNFAGHEADTLNTLRGLRPEPPAELIKLVRERRPVIDGCLVEVEYVSNLLGQFGIELVISESDYT